MKGRPRLPQIQAAYQAMQDHGIPYDAFVAYQAQVHNCKRRGIELRFTLPEWWEWWRDDWHRRGRKAGKVMMLRKGDQGHYEPGNVYLGTAGDNMRDAVAHPTDAQRAAWANYAKAGAAALRKHNCKPVVGPAGTYSSLGHAVAATGHRRETIARWCRRKRNGWAWAK